MDRFRRHIWRIIACATALALLLAIAGVAGWRAWHRHADQTWLAEIHGLTPAERASLSDLSLLGPHSRPDMLEDLRRFDRCVVRYHRDGAADAARDVRQHRAAPFWGHSGGNTYLEWTPGYEDSCAPPLRPPGVNLPPDLASRRGHFQALDQMGAEFEDGQWRTGLTERCERASRVYAAHYNRMLARLDPTAFRECGKVPPERGCLDRFY